MKRLKKYGWTGMLSLALLLGQPGAKDALAETAENCFEGEQQVLFERLDEEKREKYFDLHPDWEKGEEEDTSGRSASFLVKEDLNRIAASRLAAAMENGYSDGKIPGQGDLSEYLSSVSYRPHATCLELYLRRCEDGEEAWEKAAEWLERNYDKAEDRKYTLEYYRYIGMNAEERDGKTYFMVLLLR